ncbi:hypothetical protein NA78x_003468 [Anatilimnocola sp. NA78]|uniref:hypothetical protein n=1 Tax=Anatilimnocola sp. NA78 TaxID=3415683 RepID=UPI003CE51E9D
MAWLRHYRQNATTSSMGIPLLQACGYPNAPNHLQAMMTNRAPLIIAIVLLLLPVLYVVSYLAIMTTEPDPFLAYHQASKTYPGMVQRIFWPLEIIDRQFRPDAFEIHLPPHIREQMSP